MPFLASGGGGGGTAAPVTMQVQPDQILALKARYEAVRDTVQDFLDRNRDALRARPLADDDVSRDAAQVFTENATTAIDVVDRFVNELALNIAQLDQAAKTYKLVEELNTQSMQSQARGI
ncbi:PE domain-containing protein [Saccharothrix australiensis]|uniref:PE family protein n=1 Tax=Saccharothrix australiensis TaxID=2072 RepID=A0A495VW81_9PSEU|nr:PE domain-containing protein [Saccharothrix australiensis]RKT53454.1 PE family protein [Saccharothrix australiensis]